jgi:hypothetical protein
MTGLVKCNICGKMFNTRYLSSHTRIVHAGEEDATERKQQEVMRKISGLYRGLSAENRKKVLERLAGPAK